MRRCQPATARARASWAVCRPILFCQQADPARLRARRRLSHIPARTPIFGIDKELGGPAFPSRSATTAGPRPVRKYPPLWSAALSSPLPSVPHPNGKSLRHAGPRRGWPAPGRRRWCSVPSSVRHLSRIATARAAGAGRGRAGLLLLVMTGCGAGGTTAATATTPAPCPTASPTSPGSSGSPATSPGALRRACAAASSAPSAQAAQTAGRWRGTLHLTETYGGYTCPENSSPSLAVASNGKVSGTQVGRDDCTKVHFPFTVAITGDLAGGVFSLKLFAPQGHLKFPLSTPATVIAHRHGAFSQGTTWICAGHPDPRDPLSDPAAAVTGIAQPAGESAAAVRRRAVVSQESQPTGFSEKAAGHVRSASSGLRAR
jgi:hypothetical protein